VETILLTPEKFLLKPEQFHIWALHNMAIPTGINKELKEAIQEAIKTDTLTGQMLRAKDPKVRHARVCMTVAGLVLQGITGG